MAMASLLRVSRGFARQVAAPPVARLGSGGAALSDVPQSRRRRLSLFFLRGGRAMSSHTDAPSPPASDISGTTPHKDKADKFVAVDKDLESDEALWALYERWCKHFDMERDHDEMLRRFPEFKKTALSVDRVNKANNLPYNNSGFNQLADAKLSDFFDYDDLGLDDDDEMLDPDSPYYDPDSPLLVNSRKRRNYDIRGALLKTRPASFT